MGEQWVSREKFRGARAGRPAAWAMYGRLPAREPGWELEGDRKPGRVAPYLGLKSSRAPGSLAVQRAVLEPSGGRPAGARPDRGPDRRQISGRSHCGRRGGLWSFGSVDPASRGLRSAAAPAPLRRAVGVIRTI